MLRGRRMKMGVFIERDGILNQVRIERQHPVSPLTLEDFHIKPEVVQPLERLKAAGLVLIVTTHQPGLSRGYLANHQLEQMHDQLRRVLPLDDIFVCPHDEHDRCSCRKPSPGLLLEAGRKWRLDLDRSFVVSDKAQDAEAARNAGCTSLLLQSPWAKTTHRDFLLPDLESIVRKIFYLKAVECVAAD
jgi:D-glycero-D-manno-heptose 1,7-bisphosphate phosphatase